MIAAGPSPVADKHCNEAYLSMLRRMVRGAERRLSGEHSSPDELGQLAQLHAEVGEMITRIGIVQVERGASFAELAQALGVSRQAARQRFNPAHLPPAAREVA